MVLKMELLDFNITKAERTADGRIRLFDAPFEGPLVYGPVASCLTEDTLLLCDILSYCASGDVFADAFYSICLKAFAGKS